MATTPIITPNDVQHYGLDGHFTREGAEYRQVGEFNFLESGLFYGKITDATSSHDRTSRGRLQRVIGKRFKENRALAFFKFPQDTQFKTAMWYARRAADEEESGEGIGEKYSGTWGYAEGLPASRIIRRMFEGSSFLTLEEVRALDLGELEKEIFHPNVQELLELEGKRLNRTGEFRLIR